MVCALDHDLLFIEQHLEWLNSPMREPHSFPHFVHGKAGAGKQLGAFETKYNGRNSPD